MFMRASLALTLVLLFVSSTADAQVTKLEIASREPVANGQTFGTAGAYEQIRGRIYGEVDPRDAKNRIIQDIELAPRNARGKVEYVATFSMMKPVDLSKASGVLIYSSSTAATAPPRPARTAIFHW